MSSRPKAQAPEFIPIGKIVGAFGIDGRLKIEMLTSFPERFAKGATVFIRGQEHTIRWVAYHKTQARVQLDAFTTPEQVEEHKWDLVEVPEGDRPDLEEDEYYTADLIGMRVVTMEGRDLGEVDEVLDYPAHEVFRVGEILIPAVHEFVKEIDFDEEIIRVQLIPGMLPEEEPEQA